MCWRAPRRTYLLRPLLVAAVVLASLLGSAQAVTEGSPVKITQDEVSR